jgi:hypothetical protein
LIVDYAKYNFAWFVIKNTMVSHNVYWTMIGNTFNLVDAVKYALNAIDHGSKKQDAIQCSVKYAR